MDTTDTYYTSAYETNDPAVVLGILGFSFFVAIVAYVIGALLLSRIFKKAGLAGWPAWVPVYSNWKMMEIGGQQGYWAVLLIVPIVQYVAIVFQFIAMYHIGLKLGKSGGFVALGIFLPIVWLIWLAVDSSKWDDDASTAPSLAKGPLPTAA